MDKKNNFKLNSIEPWQNRWLGGINSINQTKIIILLKGQEYHEILTNIEIFSKQFQFPILSEHPTQIYFKPQSLSKFYDKYLGGAIYFIKQQTLQKLGFPRLNNNIRKNYKWKKMNFQTPLPKSSPKVTYIVCSTSSGKYFYRMHAVQLYSKDRQHNHILCHILQIKSKSNQNIYDEMNKPIIPFTSKNQQKYQQKYINLNNLQENQYQSQETLQLNQIGNVIYLSFPLSDESSFLQQKIKSIYHDEESITQKTFQFEQQLNFYQLS